MKNISIKKELMYVFLFVSVLSIIFIPLPKYILDILLICIFLISFLMVIISIFTKNISSYIVWYPTILVLMSLYFVAIGISATRIILKNTHMGIENTSFILSKLGIFIVDVIPWLTNIYIVISIFLYFFSTKKIRSYCTSCLDILKSDKEKDDKSNKTKKIFEEMIDSLKFIKGSSGFLAISILINLIGGLMIGIYEHQLSAIESANLYYTMAVGYGVFFITIQFFLVFSLYLITTSLYKKINKNNGL